MDSRKSGMWNQKEKKFKKKVGKSNTGSAASKFWEVEFNV